MAAPVIGLSQALQAYQNAARGTSPLGPRDDGDGSQFADLVKGAIQGVIDSGKSAEKLSMAAIQDRADVNEVVTAVSEAELTLQTAVAIRDKVIDAYKEVLRMTI
jgi:flagellar hook-basal body complex protein FliE